jgi:hypothetical protein
MKPQEVEHQEIPEKAPSKEVDLQRRLGEARSFEPPERLETPERAIIGTPDYDAQFHHLQHRRTCATVAQQGIIEKHTGIDHGEEALAQVAFKEGWAKADGRTYTDCVGNLLDEHGIPTQRWLDGSANLDVLKRELAYGHDVIVGVDSGELYQDYEMLDKGHVVWVTGLELDADGQVTKAFVNDSNSPPRQEYDSLTFKNAWDASSREMVSTQHSALRA